MLSVYSTVHTVAVLERSSLKTFYILYYGGKHCKARFAQVGIFFHTKFIGLKIILIEKLKIKKIKPTPCSISCKSRYKRDKPNTKCERVRILLNY